MNFREAAQQKKTIEITEEILEESLPFFMNEIKQKKYGAIDGRLTVYAPKLFNLLCSLDGVGQNFLDSLDLHDNFSRIIKAGTNTKGGQSGEFFFFSSDNKLIIKSMKDSELKLLIKILPAYVNHFKRFPASLISKIYSVVTFETGEALGKEKYNLLVMRNINGYPSKNCVRSYDLKGSTYGRRTIKEEGPIERDDLGKYGTLKDLDFLDHEKQLHINPDIVEDFTNMARRDSDFLREHQLLDYSFLVLVVDHMLPVPNRKTFYRRKNRELSVVFEAAESAETGSIVLGNDNDIARLQKADSVFNMDDKSARDKDFSTLKMSNGTYYYHVGIIDYLIEYGWKKKLEVFFKKFIACNPYLDISVQRPEYYSQRFFNFVSRIIKP
jgi:hypothetical protein